MTTFAIHPSSPPHVDGVLSSSTVSTASFTAPADSVLIACVVANSSTSGTTTATVTDSTGLVWTPRSVGNFATTGEEGYAGIFTATVSTAVSRTVTVTTAGSTSTTRRPSLDLLVVTGANEADLISAASGGGTSTTNDVAFAFTANADDTLLVVAASEWQKRGVPTSSDLTGTGFDQSGATGVSGFSGYRRMGAAGPSSYNLNAAGTLAAAWNIARILVNPAPAEGVPFLPELPGSKVAVGIAWGADVSTTSAAWDWTDVTTDVRFDPGVQTARGRGDEASTSQPATCSFVLDNSSGDYSLGGQSVNWPNVRRNTPVRVQVDPGDGYGYRVVFQGYANGFTPGWDGNGTIPTIKVEASGVLRRLSQGRAPLFSSLRRSMPEAANVVAYWPCEDGKDATYIAPGLTHDVMSISGTPDMAAADAFDCSLPLPVLKGSTWNGLAPIHENTGRVQVRFLAEFPEADEATGAVLCRVVTAGTVARFDLIYETGSGGLLSMTAYNSFGVVLGDTVAVDFNVQETPRARRYSIEILQVGGNIEWRWGCIDPIGGGAGYYTGPLIAGTLGTCSSVSINPAGALQDVAVGHITVQNNVTSYADNFLDLTAYRGELATTRMQRLCAENGVPLALVGGASAITMGPQPVDTLVNLLRECETADQGVLYDGAGRGLTYVAREARENDMTFMPIDASAGELAQPFGPVDDDQRTRNRVTASRTDGASATYEDTNGPLGSATVGLYDTSIDVNIDEDSRIGDYAGWLVHLGTVEGYRYPAVGLNLRAAPSLAPGWLYVGPSVRLRIEGLADVVEAHEDDDVLVVVEGTSQTISPRQWTAVARCSSAKPWTVGVIAAPLGDVDPHVMRLDTMGSSMASARSAGATSLSVATATGGPVWTTVADDLPFEINVGGLRVTVTAVSGTTSPQTFTVTPLPAAVASGAPVELWNPPVLGL